MQPLKISRASAILTQTFFILSVSMEIAATPFCILNFFRIKIEQKRSMSKIISQNWRFAQYDESKQRFKLAAPFLDLLPTSTLMMTFCSFNFAKLAAFSSSFLFSNVLSQMVFRFTLAFCFCSMSELSTISSSLTRFDDVMLYSLFISGFFDDLNILLKVTLQLRSMSDGRLRPIPTYSH